MSARILLAIAALLTAAAAYGQVKLVHVHGLSYSSDGTRILIPSHVGMAIYEQGKWSKAPGPEHDYMGFSGTARHIYSSGHPAPGSGLVNPFGLLRSADGGKTWHKLGLEGESDFHLMAASWNTNAVYAWNPEPNSRMKSPGLHYTVNDGAEWQRARASGIAGDLHGMSVHPDQASTVALSTSQGLFVSRDYGERFTRLASGFSFAPLFDLDGKTLWHTAVKQDALLLVRLSLDKGPRQEIKLPRLKEDAVGFMAQNPVAKTEYTIATFQRDVYVTKDGGQSWKQIARRGETKND
jgi:hypothetical protein